LSNRKRKNR